MEKYNGWTNYETWRVNLEIFDGFDPSEYYSKFDPSDVYGLGESLKSYAEEVIFECAEVPNGLARDYAQAFLDAVNWQEIAAHMIQDYSESYEENKFNALMQDQKFRNAWEKIQA